MVFVEIYANNVKFGYLNPILGKLGVTHNLSWWLVGKPTVDFVFVGLPDGKDWIPLCSLVLTNKLECDGQTDGRTDRWTNLL